MNITPNVFILSHFRKNETLKMTVGFSGTVRFIVCDVAK